MKDETKSILLIEILWLCITGIVAFFVTRTVQLHFQNFPYLIPLAVYVCIVMIWVKHIFFLKYSLVRESYVGKLLFVLTIIPVLFYVISRMNRFQSQFDDFGFEEFSKYLKFEGTYVEQVEFLNGFRRKFLFWGSAALLSGIALPLRMIRSLWKQYNRGTY